MSTIFLISGGGGVMAQHPIQPLDLDFAIEVQEADPPNLMANPNLVNGAEGICGNQTSTGFFVITETVDLKKKIPRVLVGYPVVIEETRDLQTLPENKVNPKEIE